VSCSRAVSAALRRLEGVESVDVSIEKGSIDIKLKADNKVTLPQLRRTIRSNGNETRDAQISGRGRIIDRDGTPILDLLNGATMQLEARPETAPAGVVEVTGVSQETGKDTERLKISAIK